MWEQNPPSKDSASKEEKEAARKLCSYWKTIPQSMKLILSEGLGEYVEYLCI
jgi:hypothetical protein